MTTEQFQNPILSGFYPDPSICRVGEDYYMATSSFIYYPGIPIFHSKDLIHWEQIGHAIHRRDQLDYKSCEASLGLWAPTIRYHEGLFYIVNTFVSEGREVYRDNFIVTAKDPAGPWSDPVFIKGADGIDPTLFWDEDGRMWYAGNYIEAYPQYEGHHGIYLSELDPVTFQFIGSRRKIWDGARTTSKWIEAPHLYHINGWYYLMVAEGGTFSNHCVMMARAKSVEGPYEICPRNPIVTHRHLPLAREISVTGHADIVQTQNGEWWMVLLAVRPYVDPEDPDNFHFNTGRETFLVPFHWEKDGWPLLDTQDGIVHSSERKPDLPELVPAGLNPMEQEVLDDFDDAQPDLRWNTIQPPQSDFYSLTEKPGTLRLSLPKETLWKQDLQDRWHTTQPACILRRQQHHTFEMAAQLTLSAADPAAEAGIVLLQDDRYSYLLTIGQNTDGQPILRMAKAEDGRHEVLRELLLPQQEGSKEPAASAAGEAAETSLILGCTCHNETYDFWYVPAAADKEIHGNEQVKACICEENRISVAEKLPARLLSSNVNGGFTGAYVGMYASGTGHVCTGHADFDWFMYKGGRI